VLVNDVDQLARPNGKFEVGRRKLGQVEECQKRDHGKSEKLVDGRRRNQGNWKVKNPEGKSDEIENVEEGIAEGREGS
jgi:hypothetical protein